MEDLAPSALGTRDYWDSAYARELANHAASTSTAITNTSSPNDPASSNDADADDDAASTTSTTSDTNGPDEGTVWFASSRAEQRTLALLARVSSPDTTTASSSSSSFSPPAPSLPSTATVLDLGTGNGHFLHSLRRAGWAGRLAGIDYSADAVRLARAVAAEREKRRGRRRRGRRGTRREDEETGPGEGVVAFARHDFMRDPAADLFRALADASSAGADADAGGEGEEGGGGGGREVTWGPFDVAHDKGTFDAISLSPPSPSPSNSDDAADTERPSNPAARYAARVLPLLRPGGLLVLTSCNWTGPEVRAWIEGAGLGGDAESAVPAAAAEENPGESGAARFVFVTEAEYPRFAFGGRTGQQVCTLCFRKEEGPRR